MTHKKRLQKYTENVRWYFENISMLQANPSYAGRFVAVCNGKIVAVDEDVERLEDKLQAMPGCADVAMVEFLSEKPCSMLL